MDLSSAEKLSVSLAGDDTALVRWRQGAEWYSFELTEHDSGYIDPEDVLWWLLRRGAPTELIRGALTQPYPDFDVDREIEHVTMPDREVRRAEDQRRRAELREQFTTRTRTD